MYCSDIVGRLDLGQYQITPELDILVRREIVSPIGFAKLIYILSRMYYICIQRLTCLEIIKG